MESLLPPGHTEPLPPDFPVLVSRPSRAISVVRKTGPSAKRAETQGEEAAARREKLYKKWSVYYDNLPEFKKHMYLRPEPYALPHPIHKPRFLRQLWLQMRRIVHVGRRNAFSKLVDTVLIVIVAVGISALEGPAVVTFDIDPAVPNKVLMSNNATLLEENFRVLFQFALEPMEAIIK
jgi:hypothetical protein